MVKTLKPLQVATTALCKAKFVTVSLIYHVINDLLKKHLIINDDDVPAVKQFKRTVTTEIERRFDPDGPDVVTKAGMFAAVLDPRYLQLKFLSENQHSQVFKNLRQKARELNSEHEENQESNATPSTSSSTAGRSEENTSALSFLLESDDNSEGETLDDAIEKEVNRYLTPLRCDESGNSCLEWWKQNASCFPSS